MSIIALEAVSETEAAVPSSIIQIGKKPKISQAADGQQTSSTLQSDQDRLAGKASEFVSSGVSLT